MILFINSWQTQDVSIQIIFGSSKSQPKINQIHWINWNQLSTGIILQVFFSSSIISAKRTIGTPEARTTTPLGRGTIEKRSTVR